MKKDQKWRYRKYLIQQFVGNSWKAILFVVVILAFFITLGAEHIESETVREATIVGVHQTQSETPKPSRILVEFDNGNRAILNRSHHMLPEIGRRVVVKSQKRSITGITSHHFIEYVDERIDSTQDD